MDGPHSIFSQRLTMDVRLVGHPPPPPKQNFKRDKNKLCNTKKTPDHTTSSPHLEDPAIQTGHRRQEEEEVLEVREERYLVQRHHLLSQLRRAKGYDRCGTIRDRRFFTPGMFYFVYMFRC